VAGTVARGTKNSARPPGVFILGRAPQAPAARVISGAHSIFLRAGPGDRVTRSGPGAWIDPAGGVAVRFSGRAPAPWHGVVPHPFELVHVSDTILGEARPESKRAGTRITGDP
jgi:hypothetical protein